MTARKSPAQLLLATHLRELGVCELWGEFKFAPPRKWRFDIYCVNFRLNGQPVAFEIEGGIYTRGRHTRGKGFQNDLEKYNDAAARGIFVFRFSTQDVLSGKAKEFIKERIL